MTLLFCLLLILGGVEVYDFGEIEVTPGLGEIVTIERDAEAEVASALDGMAAWMRRLTEYEIGLEE